MIKEPLFQIIYWPVENPSDKKFITDDSMLQPKFLFTLAEAVQRIEDLEDPMWGHAIVDAPESEEWRDQTSMRIITEEWRDGDLILIRE